MRFELGFFVVGAVCGMVAFPVAAGETTGLWKNELAMWDTPKTYEAKSFNAGDVRAVMIEGEVYRGKPTRFFAYYGLPKGASKDRKIPGIVLVHGGAGSAFHSWVKTWNERGYAAIAMDTCGGCPPRDWTVGRLSHAYSGPDGWGDANFTKARDPLTDQWSYHAISTVIRSHSFLRSLPEVDAMRIGITGISWGGYLTACVAGVDARFAFAAPVYGCAFLKDHSCWTDLMTRLGVYGQRWDELWDARNFLADARMPVLWCTGTNDHFFPLDSLQRGYDLLRKPPQLAIRIRMPHAHAPTGDPAEITAFADSIVLGKPLLPEISAVAMKNDRMRVSWNAHGRTIKEAILVFTVSSESNWEKREFDSILIPFKGSSLAVKIPSTAKLWYVNLVTDDGLISSTRHFTR